MLDCKTDDLIMITGLKPGKHKGHDDYDDRHDD